MKRGMIIPCLIRKPAFLCASVLLLIVLTLGCDFIATSHFHTNSPTVEHVQKCRELMYIRPGVKLQPLGYSHQQGLDDSIRFKFSVADLNPAEVFEAEFVDADKLAPDFNRSLSEIGVDLSWWNLSEKDVWGASFSVPARGMQGTRGLEIAYQPDADGSTVFYVLWFET